MSNAAELSTATLAPPAAIAIVIQMAGLTDYSKWDGIEVPSESQSDVAFREALRIRENAANLCKGSRCCSLALASQ